MGDGTAIHWTDATWNPVTGCTHVSAGCEHCYAEALSLRHGWSKLPWTKPNEAANVVLHPERLDAPLHWRKPRRVFVNSMSDLFHEGIDVEYLIDIFAVMAVASAHTFQVLTKRAERMHWLLGHDDFPDRVDAAIKRMSAAHGWVCTNELDEWPLPNVWLGVSIEEDRWSERASALRLTPSGIRFVSAEPLLEGLPSLDLDGIHWLIVGGESGPGFRPMQLDWARDLRDRCRASGTAFFFKQSASIRPGSGRLLDGRLWEEYPA